MLAAFVLSQLAALPDALLALWLMLLGKGVARTRGPVSFSCRDRPRRLGRRDLVPAHRQHPRAAPLPRQGDDRARVARRAAAGVGRDDRPPRASRLSRSARHAARPGVRARPHVHVAVLHAAAGFCGSGVTVALLVSIHPALLLLAVFAIPTVLTSTWRPAVERAAQERGAQSSRLARHLFTLATTAPPGKEVRVTGIGGRLVTERRAAWERWYGPVARRSAGARRSGTRWRGRCSAPRTSARSSSWRRAPGAGRARAARPRRRRAAVGLHRRHGRRDRIPARHSGWTARGGSPGSRTTPPRSSRRPTCRCPPAAPAASASSTSRSPTPARRAACWTTSSSTCRRARWSRSSARTAPARRRSSSCWRSSTSRASGDPASTTSRSRACRPTSGARGWPARFRTSSASSSGRATRRRRRRRPAGR